MRASILFVAFSFVALPGDRVVAQNDSSEQTPSLPRGFAAPAHVGRYTRGKSHDYGNPTLGVAYQYAPDSSSTDSSFATLYLYQREADEVGWSADSVLAASAAGFKRTLEVMRSRGDYDNYGIAFEGRDSVIVGGAGKLPGYHVAYAFRRRGSTAVSFLYLFVAGNTLLKVRGTVPAKYFERTDLPSFAHNVVALASTSQ